MKPSDFQKTTQCQFDCKLKRTVKGVILNYKKELKRRKDKGIPFCELPEIMVEKLTVWDEYMSDYTAFEVCGIEIRVLDEELAKALKQLSDRNRENLLMYYFLEMSDTEIAKVQKISRAGVFKNRYRALENLKKSLIKEREQR